MAAKVKYPSRHTQQGKSALPRLSQFKWRQTPGEFLEPFWIQYQTVQPVLGMHKQRFQLCELAEGHPDWISAFPPLIPLAARAVCSGSSDWMLNSAVTSTWEFLKNSFIHSSPQKQGNVKDFTIEKGNVKDLSSRKEENMKDFTQKEGLGGIFHHRKRSVHFLISSPLKRFWGQLNLGLSR